LSPITEPSFQSGRRAFLYFGSSFYLPDKLVVYSCLAGSLAKLY
jgi:hypothetical protein